VCLQIAAASPSYVRREEVPEAELAKERDIAAAQMAGKPPAAVQKIVEGKLEKYYSQVCLLDQPFVKNPEKMIKDLLSEQVGKLGENMAIRRFTRYQLGA
jgi:elongation factor Ts